MPSVMRCFLSIGKCGGNLARVRTFNSDKAVASAIFPPSSLLRKRMEFNKRLAMAVREDVKMRHSDGDQMEETVEKSCWGVTIKALAGFAGALALAYLFGAI